MTGFEPATSRPPDDYYKSHYNLDYQCDAYLPFLYGLIHGLNRINRDSSTCYCHHKDNYNQLHHQDYHHRIYLSTITYFYVSTYHIFRHIVAFQSLKIWRCTLSLFSCKLISNDNIDNDKCYQVCQSKPFSRNIEYVCYCSDVPII